ncbi:hypothetical protein Tasa_041_057 [Tanticharoenia sakaeratensis NBRC 103193]|uniref:Glycosyl transferase family 2 n=1 Tax=Tanticharoenia sakaeratensis NBRC 103193 TaxID=1231623 RepID=A0A0D6MNK3_9PROT|nr:hypothetical protein Tasa_041_057 [Tanticharoenia sakaeratensis NBRC 103193]
MYWAAWYFALGFDSVIVYDDASEDGTYASLLSMKGDFDIRVTRIEWSATRHDVRQVQVYNHVNKLYRDEFDWIAFFDADEYLDLYGKNVKDYVTLFDDYDCIAFNWCNFGCDGYIRRPSGPPYESFAKHSDKNYFLNRHTKVMARPRSIADDAINYVHSAPVPDDRIADAAGRPVKWAPGHPGLTGEAPDWEGARLIHYRYRSVEHLVRRQYWGSDLRRELTHNAIGDLLSAELLQIESGIDSNYSAAVDSILRQMTENYVSFLAEQMDGSGALLRSIFAQSAFGRSHRDKLETFSESKDFFSHQRAMGWASDHTRPESLLDACFPDHQSDLMLCSFQNEAGDYIAVRDGSVVLDRQPDQLLLGLIVRDVPYCLFLTEGLAPFRIEHDVRRFPIKPYQTFVNPGTEATVSFLNPRTARYLCGNRLTEVITADRVMPSGWESFRPVGPRSYGPDIERIGRKILGCPTVFDMKSASERDIVAYGAVIGMMSAEQRRFIEGAFGMTPELL